MLHISIRFIARYFIILFVLHFGITGMPPSRRMTRNWRVQNFIIWIKFSLKLRAIVLSRPRWIRRMCNHLSLFYNIYNSTTKSVVITTMKWFLGGRNNIFIREILKTGIKIIPPVLFFVPVLFFRDNKLALTSNKEGWTPLMYACYYCHANIANYLTAIEPSCIYRVNKSKQTALMLACYSSDEQLIESILTVSSRFIYGEFLNCAGGKRRGNII